MNGKDLKSIHLKEMIKSHNMHINKGNIALFRFFKISSFFKNLVIMSTKQGGCLKSGFSLLKSCKYHTLWIAKRNPNHTLWLKLSYTLEAVFPETHPHNKVSAKYIRINKESVKRSIFPTFSNSEKDEEKKWIPFYV